MKFRKIIISSILIVSLSFSSVAQAFAFDFIGAISLAVSMLQAINSYAQGVTDRRNAEDLLILQWTSTLSSSNAIRVSSDDLYSACMQFNQQGFYCEVVTLSVGSLSNVKVIRCTSTPYSMKDGTPMCSPHNFVGEYFAPTSTSTNDPSHLLYAVGDNSAYNLEFIRGTLNAIATSVNSIIGFVDGVESSLDSISGKLSYNNQSVAYYAYYINSRIQNVYTRLGTVDSHIQSIMGYVDGVEGLLTDIYGRQQDTIDAIYEVSQDIIGNVKDLVLISNDYQDDNDDPLDRRLIPYESATDICAYLNEHLYGKKIDVIDAASGAKTSRYFLHCYLSDSGLICVKYSAFLDHGSQYIGYLCDPRITLLQAKSPTYGQYFTAVINNVDVSLMGLLASVDANVAYLKADVGILASAVNTINNALTIDGIKIDSSSSNPISTYTIPDTLYSTGFTTDGNDVAYPLIHLAWDAACNLIAGLNSDSIGDPINHISRGGGSIANRSVVSAYIDDNNYLRVTTQSGSLTPTISYLCDPQQSIYVADPPAQSVDHWSDFLTIMSQIDGRFARLESYTDGLEDINSAILSHLDSSDLVNDSFISDLVSDWGDNLVYTVLNSDNVLSLFNAAFGDFPSDLDWAGARGFFEAFYRGGA